MSKPKHTFRIQRNTDGVDIREKCTGLDVWVPGDSTSQLNSNRGLHVQIRHNCDEETFEVSCQLQHLLAAAPELLDAVRMARSVSGLRDLLESKFSKPTVDLIIHGLDAAIAKATGGAE